MPININGIAYYRMIEACAEAGISRNTYIRWVREQKFSDVSNRDRNGWRLFSKDDILRLKGKANQIQNCFTTQNQGDL